MLPNYTTIGYQVLLDGNNFLLTKDYLVALATCIAFRKNHNHNEKNRIKMTYVKLG